MATCNASAPQPALPHGEPHDAITNRHASAGENAPSLPAQAHVHAGGGGVRMRICMCARVHRYRYRARISMSRGRSILSGNISWRAGPFQGIRLRICLQGPTPGSRQSAGAHTATGIGRRERESALQHTHLHAGDSTCTQWHQDRERFIRHASYAYACETKLKSCMSCFSRAHYIYPMHSHAQARNSYGTSIHRTAAVAVAVAVAVAPVL